MDGNEIAKLIEKHGRDQSSLIAILQDLQRSEGFLSRDNLDALAGQMRVPLSLLYGLATFYRSFSLTPTGRHRISVCMGTACHVRGGQAILDRIERDLSVRAGGTTANRQFTLEAIRCLGCCSIGPVVRVDGDIFGKARQDKIANLLKNYQ